MSVLNLSEIRARLKVGSQVLWVYEYNGRQTVEDGSVIGIYGGQVDLCWLEGYKSRNDTVEMKEILAVFDKKAKETFQVSPFSGAGYLTEAGVRWVAAQANADSAA